MGRSWDFYNDIAEIYDSQYEEPYWKLYHSVTEKLIYRKLEELGWNESGKTVLDLGGGTGYWLEFYNFYGFNVNYIEPSEKMLNIAKMKAEVLEEESSLDIVLDQGIAESLPYEDNSFDIINAQGDVLSYCLDVDSAMKEIRRTLKKDGLLIASVDSLYAFTNDAVCTGDFERYEKILKERKSQIGDKEHSQVFFETRLFDTEYIEELSKKYKFEIVEIAGKIVFGPYEKEIITEKFEMIEKIEIENCTKPEYFGKSEHIHFILKKL